MTADLFAALFAALCGVLIAAIGLAMMALSAKRGDKLSALQWLIVCLLGAVLATQ